VFSKRKSTAIVPSTQFPRHTSNNVPLVRHAVDYFHVFKIIETIRKLSLKCKI